MRTALLLLLLPLALATCGGDGGGNQPNACNVPACFLDVIGSCVPQGACRMESTSSGFAMCWDNGVKELGSVDPATFQSTVRFTKPDGSTCWSYQLMTSPGALPDKLMVDYKDGSGRTFATLTYQSSTGEVTIACPGGPPQSLRGACAGSAMSTMGGGGDPDGGCTKGTCR